MDVDDFIRGVFGYTEGNVELRSFAEDKSSDARSRPVFTRNLDIVDAHISRFDVAGRGMFFGVCTRRPGVGTGRREDLLELPALWIDVDCDKDGIGRPELLDALESVPCRPTFIVESGGGIHAYWLLSEALSVPGIGSQEEEELVLDLKRLANVFAGDTKVAELARVMRLPGTHNSKRGDRRPVEVLQHNNVEYELEDLSEWLDYQRPMLSGSAPTAPKVIDPKEDPYGAYVQANNFKPAIDVDTRLEVMTIGGAGDTSIHETQLQVSASLVSKGFDEDRIVEILLEATQAAAGIEGEKWNWRREEANIRRMIVDAHKKFKKSESKPKEKIKLNGSQANAEELAGESKAETKTHELISDLVIPRLGTAVLDVWQENKGELLATNGELFTYADGYWRTFDKALDQELEVQLQLAIAALNQNPSTSTISATKKYITYNPTIFRPGIQFNQSGLIVCSNVAIDPRSGQVYEHDPKHYSLFGIECEYDEGADCPIWFEYLGTAFQDQGHGPEIIELLQEWFGAALVRNKPRELRKALVAYGPSRTGKTVLASVLRALIGGKSSALQMKELAESFGRQTLVNSTGWIADDAISPGDVLDAENWKTIVSGEPVSIPRKNLGNWEGELDIPVMLTANSLPRVKDESDAVYNRTIFLNMTSVRSEEEVAGRVIVNEIREELAGILNWAIEGWQRLEARGRFDPPAKITEAGERLRTSQDPVFAWIQESLEIDPDYMVDRRDLCASFHGYQIDAEGRRQGELFGSKRIYRSIEEHLPGAPLYRVASGERYYAGIKCNDIGSEYFRVFEDSVGFGKTVGSGKGHEHLNAAKPKSVSLERRMREANGRAIF